MVDPAKQLQSQVQTQIFFKIAVGLELPRGQNLNPKPQQHQDPRPSRRQ